MSNNKALLDMIETLDEVIKRAWKLMSSNQSGEHARLLEVILKANEMKFEAIMAAPTSLEGEQPHEAMYPVQPT